MPLPTKPPQPQEKTFEDFQADLQKQSMSNVRLMLITMLANDPPVSSWPLQIRKFHYTLLLRAADLFAPLQEGEYDDAEPTN